MLIEHVTAHEILDSRGNPTVEAQVGPARSTGNFAPVTGYRSGGPHSLEAGERSALLGKRHDVGVLPEAQVEVGGGHHPKTTKRIS